MSNYDDYRVKCPKCSHSPMHALDNVPRHHEYTYQCDRCGFKTTEYKSLPVNEKYNDENKGV